jgi:CHAD domain-containing protein
MQVNRAAPLEIKPDIRLADAFQQIITECIRHVDVNAPLVGTHSIAVHQMRVGLRRARSALSLFKSHLVSADRKLLNQQLRELGNRLSNNRDWDVFIEETLPKVQKLVPFLDDKTMATIRDLAMQNRQNGDLGDIENSWQTLSEKLCGIATRGNDLNEEIEDIAPDLLGKEARRVRHCICHIDTPEHRHNLRKALKRMRYSTEFLESLYRHKAVKHYLERCKDCQDVLGQMNDNATLIRLCHELDCKVSDSMIEWAERQEAQAIRRLAEPLDKFRSTKPFWH